MRRLCVRYIKRFIGLPYRWKGDDPIKGFDCSGLVVEMFKMAGIMKEHEDLTADGIKKSLKDKKVEKPKVGVLVFYGTEEATHVGICLNRKYMIEAGGGSSKVDTEEEAADKNAYIRIRPIDRRSDILGFYDPFL